MIAQRLSIEVDELPSHADKVLKQCRLIAYSSLVLLMLI